MHAIQKTSRMASEEASQDTSETPSLQSPPQNNTHDDLTAGVRRRLATALGARRYDLTFAHAVHLSVAQPADPAMATAITAVVPGRFFAQRLRNDYADALRTAVNAELNRPHDAPVALQINEDPNRFPAVSTRSNPAPSDRPTLPRHSSRLTTPARRQGQGRGFDQFVVGTSNELAHNAARAAADLVVGTLSQHAGLNSGLNSSGQNDRHVDQQEAMSPFSSGFAPDEIPNVLVLHGGCGLGKTHLLQAVCQRALTRSPHARVRYITGEQFVNQFIEAIRGNSLKTFRAGLRRLDLLAIDDMQFFANKTKSQQEFLHCFDQIEQSGARVVMASDLHPRELPAFSEALISRCIRGLVVEIHAPDETTRHDLIARLARRRGLALKPGVAALVSTHAGPSVREIEGAVTHLQALVTLAAPTRPTGLRVPRVVSLHDAQRLTASTTPMVRPPTRFDTVFSQVTTGMNVTREQIITGSRQREVVLARGLMVYLARELTTLSYPEMARALNKRSHSTLVSSRGRFKTLLATNAPILLSSRNRPVTPKELLAELRTAILAQS